MKKILRHRSLPQDGRYIQASRNFGELVHRRPFSIDTTASQRIYKKHYSRVEYRRRSEETRSREKKNVRRDT
ncbi:hypothetical protein Tco_0489559 [Tanacetum coccineum]